MVGYRIVICTILLGGMNHHSSSALVLIEIRHSSRKSQADHSKPYAASPSRSSMLHLRCLGAAYAVRQQTRPDVTCLLEPMLAGAGASVECPTSYQKGALLGATESCRVIELSLPSTLRSDDSRTPEMTSKISRRFGSPSSSPSSIACISHPCNSRIAGRRLWRFLWPANTRVPDRILQHLWSPEVP